MFSTTDRLGNRLEFLEDRPDPQAVCSVDIVIRPWVTPSITRSPEVCR